MSGFRHSLLSFGVLGYIFFQGLWAWHVKIPRNIKGLSGSCLVIPCTFDYYEYPPLRPDRVVWYQYKNKGYPLVYDNWYKDHVINIFKGRTRVFSSKYKKTCTLEIYPVNQYHHQQKLYPWVDPENVGKTTFRFYDTTVTIEVVDRAATPYIMISGSMKVGESVTVQCYVYHTCSTYPPTLSLNIPLQHHSLVHVMTDGTSRTTLTTTLNIERDHQTVECSVRHKGGQTARATKPLTAKCSFLPLTISQTSDTFLEGQPRTVTCTASYTCPTHLPNLSWNYVNMPTTTKSSKSGIASWRTVSTLTFTASSNDHGRSLTCYAQFNGGQMQEKSITLRVKRNMLSLGWSFTTPNSITGMKGSCIVIPCTFTYSISQPADLKVAWYLYQSNGYPSVYEKRRNVISKYQGITSLIPSVGEGNCSLKIERLDMSHNQDRLYPWVDKNPITSYHSLGHSFNDKTCQLIVSDQAQEPQLSIIGIPRVGEESTITCSVRHTCASAPPELILNGIPATNVIGDTLVYDWIWERTAEHTWAVKEEDQSVMCTVRHRGGQEATSELKLNVECPYDQITMTERLIEATEGVAKSVVCSVSYKCRKNKPSIGWNFEDLQSYLKTKFISNNTYETLSNITFIGSLGDNGKPLTCTATFLTGETSDSATLLIKKYERPIDPHENDTLYVQAVKVPFRFNALTGSCVVIPCSLPYQEVPITRGIWSKKTGDTIYHNAQSKVIDHFKGRTKMKKDLSHGDCSLEIDDIRPFDNGPFCFHAEIGHERHKYNNSCVFIVMKASPEKPVMTPVPAEVDAGLTINVSCSVTHTCASHPPVFSWSVPNITSKVQSTMTTPGVWETTSTITFIAAGGDGVMSLTCTAVHWLDKRRASTVQLTVKGSSSWPLIAAVSAISLILIIIAAVIGVFFYRRRRRPDNSLTPPPGPEKRRSLWDRVSRRNRENRERPPRPEKRGSIWRRFSKNQGNKANLSVGYSNNSGYVSWNQKQRCPSPKTNRRPPNSDRLLVSIV
ncbi:myelin-associated glycoprotein-like [Notothenia coriiceps]|uniref:Myelin-associated glycoprotein-like n=1 Tax=Notothenia coriiceps TaxID=8208 RepID=A0A6I9NW53_9TELE|nr:PREDICTED: myelin-associated glycoprotein-like [Notothenia coriiceps]